MIITKSGFLVLPSLKTSPQTVQGDPPPQPPVTSSIRRTVWLRTGQAGEEGEDSEASVVLGEGRAWLAGPGGGQ